VIPHCEVSSFAAEVIPVLFVTIASDAESQALADLTRHAAGRVAARAWMVLWSSEGVPVGEIAARLRRRPKTVRKWLRRFARAGAAAFADLPRSGRPLTAPAVAAQGRSGATAPAALGLRLCRGHLVGGDPVPAPGGALLAAPLALEACAN